jgi:peptidyl-prolyl cis-trans isomerase SurA
MKFIIAAFTVGAFIALAGSTARAQDPELVNEIVAQVNNDIITRADYLQALRDFREELGRQLNGKPDAEINAEFEKLRPTVLDLMIEDLLLEQKAKELNMDVEAEVNQQMIAIAKENGAPNVIEFEAQMKAQGVDPEVARSSLRKNLQHQEVIQKEVMMPIYQSISDKEKREFYDKHKDAFIFPGDIVLSEVFLPLDNQTAAEVEQRARRLVTELRAGGSFEDAVMKNSPPTQPSRAQQGKMGSFKADEIKPEVKAAIADLKPGQVSDPIRVQNGFQIIRLDERKPSVVHAFEEPEVQRGISSEITRERAEAAQKKYTKQLREDAYVDVKKPYVVAEGSPVKGDPKQPKSKE